MTRTGMTETTRPASPTSLEVSEALLTGAEGKGTFCAALTGCGMISRRKAQGIAEPRVPSCSPGVLQRTSCPCWTQTSTRRTPVSSLMPTPCSQRTSATLATPPSDAPRSLAWDPPEVMQHYGANLWSFREALVVLNSVCVNGMGLMALGNAHPTTTNSLSTFTWHSRKSDYWLSPAMIVLLRCMYTP